MTLNFYTIFPVIDVAAKLPYKQMYLRAETYGDCNLPFLLKYVSYS